MSSRDDVQQLRGELLALLGDASVVQLHDALEAVLDTIDRADADQSWLVTRSALVAALRRVLL